MAFIDWSALRNPVYARRGWSCKDACVVFHAGLFHVFTSVFDEERSSVVHVTTPDWRAFSGFRRQLTGTELGAVGLCSPNVTTHAGRWYLHCNTWGQPAPPCNQLYYLVSEDLETWSAPRPLAPELTAGKRCIDVALARAEGFWVGVWKEGGTTRAAAAEALDGPWRFIDGGRARLLRADGRDCAERGMTHENCQLLAVDGAWHLLATDYEPHEPWLYRLAGDPAEPGSWARWEGGFPLRVPAERFNAMPADLPCVRDGDFRRPLHVCPDDPDKRHIVDGLCNAPFLADWRAHDGWFYLLYAGKNEEGRNAFCGTAAGGIRREGWPRGWNRLALARSRDLRSWSVPPS